MALLELTMITSAIVEMNVEAIAQKLGRREAVLRTLQKLGLDVKPLANDFDAIYTHALVEYGVLKPEPVLKFLRNEFIREAFRQAFYGNDWAILEEEAKGMIEWNQETRKLGYIDYDPRREFTGFSAVFHQIVDNTRTPSDVKRDQKLEDVHQKVDGILSLLDQLNPLNDVRSQVTPIAQSNIPPQLNTLENQTVARQTNEISSKPTSILRWLHLSDFHVGKDGYGQGRLFTYLLDHIRSRVISGLAPDLVFITGDIANKGKATQYQEFGDKFLFPLVRVGQALAGYDPITFWLRLNVTGSDPCYVLREMGDTTLRTVNLMGSKSWIVSLPGFGAASEALEG